MTTLRTDIDAAATRLAHTASFPTFAGGLYAFADADLRAGTWFGIGSDNPLMSLAYAVVEVLPRPDADFELVQAHVRIAIEDAVALARSRASAS